ncbi:HAMP domain-containing protein [Thiolapillus sp.]
MLFVSSAAAITYLISEQSNTVDKTIAQSTNAVSRLNDLLIQLEKTRRYEKEYFIYIGNLTKKKKYVREWTESINNVSRMLEFLIKEKEGLFTDAEHAAFRQWKEATSFYSSEFRKIIDEYKDLNYVGEKSEEASKEWTVKANAAIKDGKNALRPVFSGIAEIRKKKESQLVWGRSNMREQARFMIYLTIGATVFAAIVMLLLMRSINKSIVQNLRDLSDNARALTQGDFSVHFSPTGVEELDELAASLNKIKSKLLVKRTRRA